MSNLPPPISSSRKVFVMSEGSVYRTLEGPDIEKLQNEALMLVSELKAQGKRDVSYKTLQGISG